MWAAQARCEGATPRGSRPRRGTGGCCGGARPPPGAPGATGARDRPCFCPLARRVTRRSAARAWRHSRVQQALGGLRASGSARLAADIDDRPARAPAIACVCDTDVPRGVGLALSDTQFAFCACAAPPPAAARPRVLAVIVGKLLRLSDRLTPANSLIHGRATGEATHSSVLCVGPWGGDLRDVEEVPAAGSSDHNAERTSGR
jgi:hypothetical protein